MRQFLDIIFVIYNDRLLRMFIKNFCFFIYTTIVRGTVPNRKKGLLNKWQSFWQKSAAGMSPKKYFLVFYLVEDV